MMWRLPEFSQLPSLPVFFSLVFFHQNIQVYLWQHFIIDLQAVIYFQAVQRNVTLFFSLCLLDRKAPGVDELFIFVSESSYSLSLFLFLACSLFLSCMHPENRRTNSVCWEEVWYNQFVKGTQAIIKPEQQLGANVVHHSLLWPARATDLM